MRRNNSFNFNPRQIERHLSPFGQQVLSFLIKQWNTDSDRNRRNRLVEPPRYNHAQNRVLTFGESHAQDITHRINTTYGDSSPFQGAINDDGPFELPSDSNYRPFAAPTALPVARGSGTASPSIPTSVELVVSSRPQRNFIDQNVSRDDLILQQPFTKTTENNILTINNPITPRNVLNEIYGSSDDEDGGLKLDCIINTINQDCNILDSSDNVNWGDMFDSELFTEANNNNMIGNLGETRICDNDVHRDENTFNVKFPHVENNLGKNSFKKPQAMNKKTKRKNQTKDPASETAKKVKTAVSKSNVPKNNKFRKEKYTKVVKKWLNDVNPNNPVEKETFGDTEIITDKPEHKNKKNEMKKVVEKSSDNEKNKKKVIQSELANKGGIMKFGKPKNTNVEMLELMPAEPGTSTTESKDTNTKEKKSRPKFVAPIKSQIPVKDIVYKVDAVGDSSAEQNGINLCNVKDTEITAILLYSNGFCQLNNQHTDDSCVPEAVMCHIDDAYFCLKAQGLRTGEILATILRNNTIICYDGKALLIYLMSNYNLEFDTTLDIIDTKIAGSLLEPDNPPENFSELLKIASHTIEFTVATECPQQKAAWYISVLRECYAALRSLLQENSLWNVLIDIEMPLLPIIADMEHTGIRVDLESLKSMESILLARMKQVEAECHLAAGRRFQVTSAQQVRALLYDELQLDTRTNVKIRETIAKGAKSTSETMLRGLVSAHPLPALILEHRRLHKAHATFLAGIAPHVKDGVIRPTWVQTAAATGRIACSNPNLQAIPKGPFLVDTPGDTANAAAGPLPDSVCLRAVYIPRAGRVLVAADFRQVECRVFARAAGDAALQRALAAPDLFRELAAQWLQKPEQEISESDRERTKRIVYASLYGAGTHKLMDILAVDYQRALAVAASFNRTFPSLRSFGRETAEACEARGGAVRTLCGRARRLPLVASRDAAHRAHAHRQAVNFIVQGTAADLCKVAMVQTQRRLAAGGAGGAGGARLLLQIHDELVWEVREHQLRDVARVIKEEMERCGARAGLPALPVALRAGRAWGRLAPYAVDE